MRNSSFYAYSTSFRFDFFENKASNEKILFHIFYLILHVE